MPERCTTYLDDEELEEDELLLDELLLDDELDELLLLLLLDDELLLDEELLLLEELLEEDEDDELLLQLLLLFGVAETDKTNTIVRRNNRTADREARILGLEELALYCGITEATEISPHRKKKSPNNKRGSYSHITEAIGAASGKEGSTLFDNSSKLKSKCRYGDAVGKTVDLFSDGPCFPPVLVSAGKCGIRHISPAPPSSCTVCVSLPQKKCTFSLGSISLCQAKKKEKVSLAHMPSMSSKTLTLRRSCNNHAGDACVCIKVRSSCYLQQDVTDSAFSWFTVLPASVSEPETRIHYQKHCHRPFHPHHSHRPTLGLRGKNFAEDLNQSRRYRFPLTSLDKIHDPNNSGALASISLCVRWQICCNCHSRRWR